MLSMARSCRDCPAYWVPALLFLSFWYLILRTRLNSGRLSRFISFHSFWVKLSTSCFFIIPQTFREIPAIPPSSATLRFAADPKLRTAHFLLFSWRQTNRPLLPPSDRNKVTKFCIFQHFLNSVLHLKDTPSHQIRSDSSSWKSRRSELLVLLALATVALGAAWKVFTESHL